ncbi:MAG: glutaminyl-tRNA synthase (glutamine-hydrolyzing) subunit B [Candidatus Yanofskybacteria bacterium RIFCSPLOWO2_01_FULL_42_49]|uniref:Aspartyl/glutamyl-tRNA(Asn/Gln) amidotransferase subunit B n=1 Tax=Candidatus Yanofskybacteria bacterium RIFCSPLOWO2_01_FULL_42_49 TaxID=1802694 RepID=A0A1F8GBX5_9BACT|nr:MAG: glutaminyl-tRNA synthase (glutamine-hydrolyzing) subunit B [Candidatus Yanofskybacteria bacterium RIFCSPLOWO2_01_FULL_42_49]
MAATKYKPVIGLEIHAELKTKTKMFCDSLNDPDEKHPNVNVCPICMGHPGTLPVANEDAVKKVIMTGLALNCKIEKDTFFERKNYFYPDLPKGYQISQYQKPLCYEGYLDIKSETSSEPEISNPKRIRITRIHLEEDAGRLYHPTGADYSLVDFNRAGVPLMELVTEPDLESGQEVKKFAEELQLIWRYLNVSDADMEKGQMRVEVNISLRPELPISNPPVGGQLPNKLGTKVEVKNINSIKFAADAVNYEIKRQTELLEAGEKVKQETRGWDEKKGETYLMRTKEEAQDYRYFPEPDLPPLHFEDVDIEDIKSRLPELPQQRRERFAKQYGLPEKDTKLFTTDKLLGDYFEHVASELLSFDPEVEISNASSGKEKSKSHYGAGKLEEHHKQLFKLAANYLITELKRMAEEVYAELADTKVLPEMLADLVVRIFHGEVSSSGAQTVLKEMFATGASPGKIIEEKDLAQLSSIGDLEMAVDKVVADNPKAVEDYKKGKEASLKFLVGMAMRETKGKANPQIIEGIFRERLRA